MRIGVIGTGRVGTALGMGWARAGHEVIFGARKPPSGECQERVSPSGSSPSTAKTASVAEAVALAEVIVLAIPWAAVQEVLRQIAPALSEKVLIDCTNPAKEWPSLNHSAGSGGEQVARMAPGARVVKAFNTTGFENMQNPKYGDDAATMFYAGDDPEAKSVVHRLAFDLGFDPIDAGRLSQAHSLEVLASLWGGIAYGQKLGRGIAFRLLRR